jgi:hypothetical protein
VTVVGDRVRVQRDETRYRSKGTWPQFRGRVGTVVEINWDKRRPHLTEHGGMFGAIRPRPNGHIAAADGRDFTTWFHPWELCVISSGSGTAPVRHADGLAAAQCTVSDGAHLRPAGENQRSTATSGLALATAMRKRDSL